MNILKKIILFIIDKTADSMNSAFGAVLGAVCALYFTKEGVSKVINNISVFIFSQNINISPLMLFAVISLIIAISYSLLIYSKNSSKKLEENNLENVKSLEPIKKFDFEVMYEECIHQIVKGKVIYERKLKLRSLSNNLKYFPFSNDYPKHKVKSLIKNQDIIQVGTDGYFKDYQIVFPNYVKENEIISIHIEIKHDYDKVVGAFFGKIIKYKIHNLCIKLYFDEFVDVQTIMRTHYEYFDSNSIKNSETIPLDKSRVHEWNIPPNPELEHYYKISWK